MNLITGSVLSSFSGAFGDLFDTFSRNIIIFKEPKKTIVQQNVDNYIGYSSIDSPIEYTYTPVSGIYPAQIIYSVSAKNQDILNKEANINLPQVPVKIKVKEDARDFIQVGKTENILIDGQVFNLNSQYEVQNYLGLQYYYFELLQTS